MKINPVTVVVGSTTAIPIQGGGSATAKTGESLILLPGSGVNFSITSELSRPGPDGDGRHDGKPIPVGQEWFATLMLFDGGAQVRPGVDATPSPNEKGNEVWLVNPATNKPDNAAFQLTTQLSVNPGSVVFRVKFLKAGNWIYLARLWFPDGSASTSISRNITVV